MTKPFFPRVGGVLSADIAVPEHEREVRFYSRVLTTGEDPLWREDLMNNAGLPIIGLGERGAEFEHLPIQWMPHIQVADVAASAARALELGGVELMHARDDDGRSQWAVLRDPDGAAFGVIPVLSAEAIPPIDGPAAARLGRISWLDLTVPDPSRTREFYRQVVGWTARAAEWANEGEATADDILLGEDGTPAAGIRPARREDQRVPMVWMLHLPVGDLAVSLRRVEEEGGAILKTTQGNDGQDVYAAIQDPVGACFALLPG